MIMFGLYLFMAILLIGGISVDIMRNEFSRLALQNTVDTAVLAAADLDQKLEPDAVVKDYFNKAGMGDYLDSISVTQSVNSRSVTASSSEDVSTLFVNIFGVETMTARATGTAHEEISDIEISMVLDVSGSMGWDSRMDEMKSAAKSFVNAVLADERTADRANAGQVSMSIVPYSTQVNIGPVVAQQINLDYTHDYSHCVDFESNDFRTTEMPSNGRNQTGHFDPWTNSSPASALVCRNDDAFQVQPLSDNKEKLLAQIDALVPQGNTSTDVGLKWGAAMLDPSFRTITDDLIKSGQVGSNFDDRPYDYGRNNTMKVLVVMTDGAHTAQYTLNNSYNQGMTDVWGREYSDGTWRFSVDHEEARDKDRDGKSYERWYLPRLRNWDNSRDGGDSDSKQLSYQELWNASSMYNHAYNMRYTQDWNVNDYYDWRSTPYSWVDSSTKNQRMRDICAEAKAKDILVFSVAFEISSSDAALMLECASSANHYFDVDGEDIVYAFSAIASTINQLRLVQ